MKISITGNYLLEHLAVVTQHLAVQLEALGIEAVEGVELTLRPLKADGRTVAVVDDRGGVEAMVLEISDLARPAVASGKLRAVEMPPAPRKASPGRKYSPRSR